MLSSENENAAALRMPPAPSANTNIGLAGGTGQPEIQMWPKYKCYVNTKWKYRLCSGTLLQKHKGLEKYCCPAGGGRGDRAMPYKEYSRQMP